MSQKAPKPVLTGQRLKTRKRDEKHHKYNPEDFRDAVVTGLNACEGSFDAANRFLDQQGGKNLEYNRYGETLFDILFCGGSVSSGGVIEEDGAGRTTFCVFDVSSEADLEKYVDLFVKLMRRYKYLIKDFNATIIKLFKYVPTFEDAARSNFARCLGFILSDPQQAIVTPSVLQGLLADHVVRDGMALKFITEVFKEWLSRTSVESFVTTMRKSGVEDRLLDFFPSGERKEEAFEAHFNEHGLEKIVRYHKSKQQGRLKNDLRAALKEVYDRGDSTTEVINFLKEFQKTSDCGEDLVAITVWHIMMGSVEWTRKADFLDKEALRHIKQNCKLLASFSKQAKTQLALLVTIQSYCYENMDFMKVFAKIVMLLYNQDVVGEAAVQKWYKDGHSAKGEKFFLKELRPMIDWLNDADEESGAE